MNSITIEQIVTAMGTLTVIVGFFVAIFKWYKLAFVDKFKRIDERLDVLEEKEVDYQKVAQDSKEERLILLEGLVACLEGLKQGGANGPVTEAIKKINDYIIQKSHE